MYNTFAVSYVIAVIHYYLALSSPNIYYSRNSYLTIMFIVMAFICTRYPSKRDFQSRHNCPEKHQKPQIG